MRIRTTSEDFFVCALNLSNHDVIFALRPGLKTGMDFGGLV